MRAVLVFNPVAGGPGSPDLQELVDQLGRHFDLEVMETRADRDADACAAQAVAAGAELVIAAGGDGTVSAVAGELIGRDVALGIIPSGTANSMARALEIPMDADGAIDTIVSGQVRKFDTAVCNGRTMVEQCSIGLHAQTMQDASREQKQRWGLWAYVATGLRKLIELEPFEVEIATPSHVIRCKAISVMVANLAPPRTILAQGPAFVSPDDGLLDITIAAPTDLADAVAAGVHLLRTASDHEPAVRDRIGYLATRYARITTERPQVIAIDGEMCGTTPMEVRCRPGSLSIRVARDYQVVPHEPDAKLRGLPDLEVGRT